MTFLAGQVPTADELNALLLKRYVQGSAQAVTSSTTIVDSAIAIPLTALCEVRLSARYTSLAGGIRWAWSITGTLVCESRDITSPGSATSSSSAGHNIAEIRYRTQATATEEQLSAHINTSTAFLIAERLILSGAGTLTFRFAQETSNGSATTLSAQSYATVLALSEG